MRGGAAAPTDILNRDVTLTTRLLSEDTHREVDFKGLRLNHSDLNKVLAEPNTGGGHRGTRMRYGNDEVKPNIMNEEGKWIEEKTYSRVWPKDKDITYTNACQPERQLLRACLSDNVDNRSLCNEIKHEVEDCQRDYAKYFPLGNERMKA